MARSRYPDAWREHKLEMWRPRVLPPGQFGLTAEDATEELAIRLIRCNASRLARRHRRITLWDLHGARIGFARAPGEIASPFLAGAPIFKKLPKNKREWLRSRHPVLYAFVLEHQSLRLANNPTPKDVWDSIGEMGSRLMYLQSFVLRCIGPGALLACEIAPKRFKGGIEKVLLHVHLLVEPYLCDGMTPNAARAALAAVWNTTKERGQRGKVLVTAVDHDLKSLDNELLYTLGFPIVNGDERSCKVLKYMRPAEGVRIPVKKGAKWHAPGAPSPDQLRLLLAFEAYGNAGLRQWFGVWDGNCAKQIGLGSNAKRWVNDPTLRKCFSELYYPKAWRGGIYE